MYTTRGMNECPLKLLSCVYCTFKHMQDKVHRSALEAFAWHNNLRETRALCSRHPLATVAGPVQCKQEDASLLLPLIFTHVLHISHVCSDILMCHSHSSKNKTWSVWLQLFQCDELRFFLKGWAWELFEMRASDILGGRERDGYQRKWKKNTCQVTEPTWQTRTSAWRLRMTKMFLCLSKCGSYFSSLSHRLTHLLLPTHLRCHLLKRFLWNKLFKWPSYHIKSVIYFCALFTSEIYLKMIITPNWRSPVSPRIKLILDKSVDWELHTKPPANINSSYPYRNLITFLATWGN